MTENDTLTARQRRVLAALVSEPTAKAAADRAKISRVTLYRYLSEPSFQAALAQQQGEVLRLSTARLAGLLSKALDVIGLDFEPGVDARTRLHAAGLVLRHVTALLEYADLEGRVLALEEQERSRNAKT